MRRYPRMRKTTASFVLTAFFILSVIVAPVQAAMVGTANILKQESRDLAHQKVMKFIERQDVARQLQAWGVNPAEAKTRVDTMTDEEISMLSNKIDQMPAGGDAVGLLLGLVVITFVVLIITDLLGVTDVFTFIKKR